MCEKQTSMKFPILPQEGDRNTRVMQRKLSGKVMCNVSSYVTLKYFQ